MRKIFFINILTCSIFVAACNQKNTTLEGNNKKANVQETHIPANVDDDFSVFLSTFSRDSVFQLSRVQFPLMTREWIDPETGMVKKFIGKSDYITLDFTYPEDAMTKEYDRYTQKINIKGNKCVVEIRGVDNGIYTDFFFEKLNGKWNLVSWNEQST